MVFPPAAASWPPSEIYSSVSWMAPQSGRPECLGNWRVPEECMVGSLLLHSLGRRRSRSIYFLLFSNQQKFNEKRLRTDDERLAKSEQQQCYTNQRTSLNYRCPYRCGVPPEWRPSLVVDYSDPCCQRCDPPPPYWTLDWPCCGDFLEQGNAAWNLATRLFRRQLWTSRTVAVLLVQTICTQWEGDNKAIQWTKQNSN